MKKLFKIMLIKYYNAQSLLFYRQQLFCLEYNSFNRGSFNKIFNQKYPIFDLPRLTQVGLIEGIRYIRKQNMLAKKKLM
ncbi:hypothetical protein TTHERM_001225667 (macronuclear) [Tetrahymena thermophila SB210]|uniref:Uncharacterized protein n=1 Tax=Tetrahymena thermophila (strain SB210) TaxID=312017 RepID=W7X386_TETTS|nr:hypothetical protein TTHERM_001225667 [Tetrahymena thermophila SB210]EWS71907.1 hypothetical protein TTHERM_001225667 [Tetrahymena thermophila SB210]|eukprot:XP_012655564.1 hypothetical protein TTHERM_001225667 [Tetrahymena thermophila SB210]